MNIKLYFERIKYEGRIDTTLEVLSKLQELHLLSTPFENLDIQNNVKIDLDNLFDKIVVRRRGGFCYELNGLFYQLLQEMGFTAKMVSARVYTNRKSYSAEFDHMAIIVSIEDDHYLVDVGFGEFAFSPLEIEPGKETNDLRGVFKIELFDDNYKVVKKKNPEGEFVPEYIFSEKERQIEEFYAMCYYHQTSKESHFTQKRICSLPTQNGRITVTGNTLKITGKEIVTERPLNNEQEMQQVLWYYFGIKP